MLRATQAMSTSQPKPVSISIPDFWKLVAQSQLYSSEQCRKLHRLYSEHHAGSPPDRTPALAQWLVDRKYLTRYQAKVLLAGRAGPFFYGDYKIRERISDGPLTGAFRAHHVPTKHPVLLAFLTGAELQDPQHWQQVRGWCTAVCGLRHPHLHRWYACAEEGSYRFLVTEELPGQSLSELAAGGRLPVSRACWLVQQLAEAAGQVHQRGWIVAPRPSLAWVSPSNVAKLMLFSLSPATTLAPDAEDVLADYRAPELFAAGEPPTVRSDVYALGCLLYQLLTGTAPFAGGSVADKAQRHAAEPIRPLQGVKAPPQLTQVVAYMMAKNPQVRLGTMHEVAQQLAPFVADEPHLMPPALPSPTLARFEEQLAQTSPLAGAAAPPPAASLVGVTPAPRAAPAPLAAPLAPAAPLPSAPIPTAPVAVPVGPAGPLTTPATAAPAAPLVQPAPPAAAPAAPAIQIAIEPKAPARRRPRRNRAPLLIGAALALVVLLGAGAWYQWGGSRPAEAEPAERDATVAATRGNESSAGSSERQSLPDDGKSLWASPTSGSPIDLAGVPPESLLTLVLRPADLLSHPQGPLVLKALGPSYEPLQQAIEAAAGVPLEEIEQLVVSLHEQGLELPRAAYVVRLLQPRPLSELRQAWGGPTQNDGLWRTDAMAYYVLESQSADSARQPGTEEESGGAGEQGSKGAGESAVKGSEQPAAEEQGEGSGGGVRAFVCGSEEQVALVAERRGAPPPPRSGMEPLLRASDSDRLLTVLFVPHFWRSNLLRDGRSYYFGEARKLREPLDWLLGDGLRAGVLSVHLAPDVCYAELLVASDLTRDKYELATDLTARLAALPELAETYVAQRLDPPDYWRRVAFRYPQMIQFVHDHTRVAVENNLTVMNTVLPLAAAHNLVFATEMVLASEPGAAASASAAAVATGPQSIEQVLDEKISLKFDQMALEATLASIAEDIRATYPKLPFEFDVKIIGEDFEKGSITRNQQIVSFSMQQATVAEVLTAIAMRANPITTVKQPSETDQKLVWAIGPDPDMPARTIVLMTTRDGAAARNLTLPQVFQSP